MSEWEGQRKCRSCGVIWNHEETGDCDICPSKRCLGQLVPYERRRPDPDKAALIQKTRAALERIKRDNLEPDKILIHLEHFLAALPEHGGAP